MHRIINFRGLGYTINCIPTFNPSGLSRNDFYELSDWGLKTFPSGLVLAYRHGVQLLDYNNNYNLVASIVHFSEPHVIAGTEINHGLTG